MKEFKLIQVLAVVLPLSILYLILTLGVLFPYRVLRNVLVFILMTLADIQMIFSGLSLVYNFHKFPSWEELEKDPIC